MTACGGFAGRRRRSPLHFGHCEAVRLSAVAIPILQWYQSLPYKFVKSEE